MVVDLWIAFWIDLWVLEEVVMVILIWGFFVFYSVVEYFGGSCKCAEWANIYIGGFRDLKKQEISK